MTKNINDIISSLEGPVLLSASAIFTGMGYTADEGGLNSVVCYTIAGVFLSIIVGLKYDPEKELKQKSLSELEQIFD